MCCIVADGLVEQFYEITSIREEQFQIMFTLLMVDISANQTQSKVKLMEHIQELDL